MNTRCSCKISATGLFVTLRQDASACVALHLPWWQLVHVRSPCEIIAKQLHLVCTPHSYTLHRPFYLLGGSLYIFVPLVRSLPNSCTLNRHLLTFEAACTVDVCPTPYLRGSLYSRCLSYCLPSRQLVDVDEVHLLRPRCLPPAIPSCIGAETERTHQDHAILSFHTVISFHFHALKMLCLP